MAIQRITPFLWFDYQAEEAATFYTSIFSNSKIGKVARYSDVGRGPAGSVMTVEFQLDGQTFVALNGGPIFKFTEAVSFVVNCQTHDCGSALPRSPFTKTRCANLFASLLALRG